MSDDEVFASGFDLSPEKRAAFLEEACRSDPAQLGRMRELFAAHGDASGFLRGPAVTRDVLMPIEGPGDRINHYKLVQRIGEGGIGVVWMAQQEHPLRRMVALKIIKVGMDTRAVVARFEAERQALALMDHPNIAKVFDAGVTAKGRPYFVMELVRGVPITTYCDEYQLTTPERLALFIQVCDAVHHAHQKGVIHRDLKPSNILVTENGGSGVPKVIDFGIAKATQGRLGDSTVFTAFEMFIGTPAYMSPEQADMSSHDVDTRSDIYSLGVLLFELLTGRTPFDAKTIMEGGYRDLSRRLLEMDAPPPSTQIATLNPDARATMARARRTAPAHLTVELKGDLDWIVMRCLERDRARRYESASALALDLQRHLRDQPILARPPSTLYLAQKLFRRRRAAMTAALASAAVVVIGGAFSAWQAVRATRAEHEQARLRAMEASLLRRTEEREQFARRRAYAADMNLAQQALANDNLGLAKRILQRQRPATGEVDLRGWEWRYLWQQARSGAAAVLAQKPASITSLSVSPDQNWVAIGQSEGGELSVLHLRTRQEIKLRAGAGPVRAVFSPTDPVLAISFFEGGEPSFAARVRLWNLATREFTAEWAGSGPIAFSGDGRILQSGASARAERLIRWKIPSGEKLEEVAIPPGRILGASADLRFAAQEVPNTRGTVRILDVSTGRERWSFDVPDEAVTAIAFSPDARLFAAAGGSTIPRIQVWDTTTGQLRATLDGHRTYITALAFWLDGQTLASASTDQTVRIWDVGRGAMRRVLRGHELEVRSLALLGDQTTLISGAKDGALFLWDAGVPEQRLRRRINNVANWAFVPNGQDVVVLAPEGTVSLWRAPEYARGEERLRIGAPEDGGAYGIPGPPATGGSSRYPGSRTVFANDASLLAVVARDEFVRVYDWQAGRLLRDTKIVAARPAIVGFTANGAKLLLAYDEEQSGRDTVHVWDVARSGQVMSLPATLDRAARYTLSADARFIAARTADGMQTVVDVTTGEERRIAFPASIIGAPSFSSNNRWLASPHGDGWVKVWDLKRDKPTVELTGFVLGVHAALFSPDNRRLMAGSGSAEAITLWECDNFERVLTLGAEGTVFNSAAFSSDGGTIGARNAGGQLHIWRAPTLSVLDPRPNAPDSTPIQRTQ